MLEAINCVYIYKYLLIRPTAITRNNKTSINLYDVCVYMYNLYTFKYIYMYIYIYIYICTFIGNSRNNCLITEKRD